jgi:ubiquinone/menaquinone biosynthesis C-methylase UbiE
VSLLDVQPTDRVLEIGFGPGLAITELARRVTRGRIYGIDHSAVMVRQPASATRLPFAPSGVELLHTSVDRLPRFDTPLDAIVAVNSVGFWPDPTEQLSKLRGLLRPGGRIALASQPAAPAPPLTPPPGPAGNFTIGSSRQGSPKPTWKPFISTHRSPAFSLPTRQTGSADHGQGVRRWPWPRETGDFRGVATLSGMRLSGVPPSPS